MRYTEDGAGALRGTSLPDPSSSVSKSWFHDPVGNFLSKTGGTGSSSAGVLQGHYGNFRVQCAIGILHSQHVRKFQGQGRRKQHFTSGAKLNHGTFAGGG